MKQPKHEYIEVPRLCKDVKAMNGKSTKRLTQCINALSDLLDANNEVQHEVVEQPSAMRNPSTE